MADSLEAGEARVSLLTAVMIDRLIDSSQVLSLVAYSRWQVSASQPIAVEPRGPHLSCGTRQDADGRPVEGSYWRRYVSLDCE